MGAPPSQQWGAPPPGPPGSSQYGQPVPEKRSKLPLILAAAALLLVAGIVAVVLLLRSSAGSGSESPKAVTEKFISAVQQRDCATAYGYLNTSMQKETGSCSKSPDNLVPPKGTRVSFGDVTVKDATPTKATTAATATVSGQKASFTFTLVKVNGVWKISRIG